MGNAVEIIKQLSPRSISSKKVIGISMIVLKMSLCGLSAKIRITQSTEESPYPSPRLHPLLKPRLSKLQSVHFKIRQRINLAICLDRFATRASRMSTT